MARCCCLLLYLVLLWAVVLALAVCCCPKRYSVPLKEEAMDLLLNPAVPAHANIRAALATALQGLLRSAEYACDAGVKWNPLKHLSRADVTECSEERLVLMMLPCKNMRHLTGKTVPLVIGASGQLIDAVAEVWNMLAVDPVSPQLAKSTPLFRDPAPNEPLRTSHVRDMVRETWVRCCCCCFVCWLL